MRSIVLNLAMSLDGYICDENGSFEWIMGHGDVTSDVGEPFDFEVFANNVDVIVMGSKAYEDCVLTGMTLFADKRILVATSRTLDDRANVEFASGDLFERILLLKEEKGKNIWLFGGALLADSFIKKNLVDVYIIGIIPIILGDGRRPFKGGSPSIELHLDQSAICDGVTVLTYSKRDSQ